MTKVRDSKETHSNQNFQLIFYSFAIDSLTLERAICLIKASHLIRRNQTILNCFMIFANHFHCCSFRLTKRTRQELQQQKNSKTINKPEIALVDTAIIKGPAYFDSLSSTLRSALITFTTTIAKSNEKARTQNKVAKKRFHFWVQVWIFDQPFTGFCIWFGEHGSGFMTTLFFFKLASLLLQRCE